MKNFYKDHPERIISVVVASVCFFIASSIVHRYYNGTGRGLFLASILLIGIMMFTDERKLLLGIGIVMIYVVIFSCLKFHYYPTVTEYTQLRTSSDTPLYKLKDDRVFCSHTDSTSVFTTISHDTVITRSSVCEGCQKEYDDHYTKILTEDRWAETDAVLKYMILTPQNL